MRSAEQKLLNAVQRPEAYREVVLGSAGARIVLSVWDGTTGMPVVLFLPGTMTHPLFYEEFLDALSRAGLTVAGLHGQGHGKSPRAHRPLTSLPSCRRCWSGSGRWPPRPKEHQHDCNI